MKRFVMRLLYSLYCAERWSYRVPMRIFGPVINRVAKLLYNWNPFGYIQKNNPTLEHYIKHVYKTTDTVFYDLNIGLGIARAEGTLVFSFVPYAMFILSVLKKLGILPIQSFQFYIFLVITCGVSLLFTYFMGRKNDEYIGYIKKFEKCKNNVIWHIISSLFFIGSICAVIVSIMWWNES